MTLVQSGDTTARGLSARCSGLTEEIDIMRDSQQTLGIWIALGAGLGVAVGLAMDNLALWLAVGVGIGLAIGGGHARLGRK